MADGVVVLMQADTTKMQSAENCKKKLTGSECVDSGRCAERQRGVKRCVNRNFRGKGKMPMVSMRSMLAYFLSDTPRVACFVISCGLVLLLAWCKTSACYVQAARSGSRAGLGSHCGCPEPCFGAFLGQLCGGNATLRFIWMIPVAVIISCVMSSWYSALKRAGRVDLRWPWLLWC